MPRAAIVRECPGPLLLLVLVAMNFSVGWRHAFHDAARPPQWRIQRDYDDTQNAVRAESIVKYGYRANPVLPRGIQQLFLLTAVATHHLVPARYDTGTRFLIALRLTAAVCTAVAVALFYVLARSLFAPWIAALVALCFAAGTGNYPQNAFSAKEDSLCFALVLGAFLVLASHARAPRFGKLIGAAILIGLGGATKQYPLFLATLLPAAAAALTPDLRGRVRLSALAFAAVAGAFLAVNPHYFFGGIAGSAMAAGTTRLTAGGSVGYEIQSAFAILGRVVLRAYAHVFVAAAVLGVVVLTGRGKTGGAPTPVFDWLRRHRIGIAIFAVSYYAASLSRNTYYPFVKYFMLGEVIAGLAWGALLERSAAIGDGRVRAAVLFLAIAAAARLSWSAGNFNHTYYTSTREDDLYAANRATFDDLADYVRALPPDQKRLILTQWYIYLPEPEFNVRRLNSGIQEYGDAVLKELGVTYDRRDLSAAVVRDVGATLTVTYEDFADKLGPGCGRLLTRITRPPPPEYRFYPQAVAAFHASWRRLHGGTPPRESGGSSFFVYDTRECAAAPR